MAGASPVGNDVVAIYPMFPGNMCKFLVFDFDNHEKDAVRNDYANRDDDHVLFINLCQSERGIDRRALSSANSDFILFCRTHIGVAT